MLKSIVALAALSVCSVAAVSSVANAGTVLFSEDFDSITANTLNIGPGNAVTMAASMDVFGEVDAVVPINGFGITGLTSTAIDLDGTPGPGGVGKGGFDLVAGRNYTLSFVVGGAQRGSVSDTFLVSLLSDLSGDLKLLGGTGVFGGLDPLLLSADFEALAILAGDTPFTQSSLNLRAVNNSSFAFRIGTNSSNNIGPLLDSVVLTESTGVIPEPATWAMLISGFGLVGTAMRRRRTLSAA
jgi:PEP-CTERM motif